MAEDASRPEHRFVMRSICTLTMNPCVADADSIDAVEATAVFARGSLQSTP